MNFQELDVYLLSKNGTTFDYSFELRSIYESVNAGYHMNKKHWNTVNVGGDVDDTLLKKLLG